MSVLVIPLVVIAVTCLIFLLIQRKRRHNIFKDLGIPGPAPNLIFGNLMEIRNNYVGALADWREKYGPLFGYFLGARPVLVVTDTELCKQIQIKDSKNFTDRPVFVPGGFFSDPRAEKNMVNSTGQIWKEQRSILTPSFTTGKMKQMVPFMNNGIDIFMEKVTEESKVGKDFDIYAMFKGLSLDIIGRTAFGIETNVQRDYKDPLYLGIQEFIGEGFVSGVVVLQILFPELIFILAPIRKFFEKIKGLYKKASSTRVLDGIEEMVEHRRSSPNNRREDLLQLILDAQKTYKEINSMKINEMTVYDETDKKAVEFHNKTTSTQKKTYRTLSNIEAVANAFLVLIGGYEAISTSLAFFAHVLVNRQDLQDKVRKEIQEVIKEKGSIDYDSASKLNFMQQMISESLRLYTPSPTSVVREALEDIRYGELTIPKGMMVQIPSSLIHKDPKHFPEPEKFDPERFAPENKSNMDPNAFQAFGNGPRNCIGLRFAQLELKLAISRLLSEFKLVPGDRTERDSIKIADKFVVQSPKNGVFVKAERI